MIPREFISVGMITLALCIVLVYTFIRVRMNVKKEPTHSLAA